MATLDLPTGRRGQLLALGLTIAVLGGLWVGVAAPLLDRYALRAEQVHARRALARRMAELAETLPAQREGARRVAAPGRPAEEGVVLEGASDAIAAAALQGRLQEMAARAGAPLSSVEALPGEAAGAWRRIGVRVAVNAPWPAIIRLLQGIGTASPRMLVDELQLRIPPLLRTGPRPVEASFTVLAFRAEAPR
jgi:general secretion pathway protein M